MIEEERLVGAKEGGTKNVLLISPTPTHPSNAGNRAHILELSKILGKNMFTVFFLYLEFEKCDREKMYDFWKDRLFIIERKKLFEKGALHLYYLKRSGQKLQRIRRTVQWALGLINNLQLKHNSEIDNFFPNTVNKRIKELNKQYSFDIVICEYAAMSKALTLFGKNTLKILDTHDCFTDRFSVYLQNNLKPEWYSFYKEEEKKAFDRADVVISVQDEEKKYFETITDTPVIRYCTVYEGRELPVRRFEKKLLYFASDNQINHKTLMDFELKILPEIVSIQHDVQVLIGGSICKSYVPINRNVILTGTFEDPFDFYSLGDIIINPEFNGTGYKIKTMEALCFGIPMVCTSVASEGLKEPFSDQFLLADTSKDFSREVIRLLENEALRIVTSENAKRWIMNLRQQVINNLLQTLN